MGLEPERRRDAADHFDQLLGKHRLLMERYCRSLVATSWDSDDLFQNASLKLFQAWKKDPLRPITKAFLYRIISSVWIDGHRKRELPQQPMDPSEITSGQQAPGINEERLMLAIRLLRERMPAKQSLVFMMRHGWGMSPSEIAEAAGLSEGNVRVIDHRAAEKLNGLFIGKPGEEADTWSVRYASAFKSGDPAQLLKVYHLETGKLLQQIRLSGNVRCAA